jgi:membrane-associated phospholipid phosphatase
MVATDQVIFASFTSRAHGPGMEKLVSTTGRWGEDAAIWILVAAGLAILDGRRHHQWIRVSLLGPLAIAINKGFKLLFRRDRPSLPSHLAHLSEPLDSHSFPSAHATSSVAVAIAMTRVDSRAWLPASGGAALLALGRPYLGVHHPSDVVAGALLGAVIGMAMPLGRSR